MAVSVVDMHGSTMRDANLETAGKLQKLLDELSATRGHTGEARHSHYNSVLVSVQATLGDVPLVHGMTSVPDLLRVFSDGCLRGRRDRSPERGAMKPEHILGIPSCIYTAAGVLYPERNVALVFRSSVETDNEVSASPWDSGHFCNAQQGSLRDLSQEQRRSLFWSHSLPSPAYREYLVHYVASCFDSATDYIDNRPHRYADPLGALTHDRWQSRIFEVRVRERLTVDAPRLLAVFIPRYHRVTFTEDFDRHEQALEGAGVSIRYYGTREKLKSVVSSWMRSHLGITK